MTKTLLFCLFSISLAAQPGFQKKLEGLQAAEGLAVLSDGGYLLAGARGNCIQILRFNANGAPVWMRQVCPSNPVADLSIGALHLVASTDGSGSFLLLFRKGGFLSSPANLLNLMKFDASGNLLWEFQLRPEKRYGPFCPGNQLVVTPNGSIWAVHGMGFTDLYPDYNQLLVFKTSPSGQPLLRQFYLSDTPATANGILAENNNEIFVYGGLGTATTDGVLLKTNELGDVLWSKRYPGMHFIQDGGFFANGDFMLMAEHEDAYALTRIKANGAVVWTKTLPDTLSLFHCAVAADEGIILVGKKADDSYKLLKIEAGFAGPGWAKSYEECTRYKLTALEATADGGFVFCQSSNFGEPRSRFVKADQFGNLSADCPVWEEAATGLDSISVIPLPIQFSKLAVVSAAPEPIFDLRETNIEVKNCCPSAKPEALFSLPDSVCANSPLELASQGSICADSWHWSLPGAVPDTAESAQVQGTRWEMGGMYPIQLTAILGECADTFSRILHVSEAGKVDFFAFSDTLLCPDQPFVVEPQLDGFESWVWQDGSTQSALVLNPPVAGTFHIAAKKGFCTLADTFQIELGGCGPTRVFVPNAFSPNDDGENDHWEIQPQQGVTVLRCQVFDRWGNLCYATKPGESPRWDGVWKGKNLPSGVFFWQISLLNLEGREEFLSGDLLLLR